MKQEYENQTKTKKESNKEHSRKGDGIKREGGEKKEEYAIRVFPSFTVLGA